MNSEELRRKNALQCNKEARARYNATYNKKKNLKVQAVRFKCVEVEEIDKFCVDYNFNKADVFRVAVLDYIRDYRKNHNK